MAPGLEIQETNYIEEHTNKTVFAKLRNTLCISKIKGTFILICFAIVIPALIYYMVIDRGDYTPPDRFTCLSQPSFRVPCGKPNITEEECTSIYCCFESEDNYCYHYFPSQYSYNLDDNKKFVTSKPNSTIGTKAIDELLISVIERNAETVSIILHDTSFIPPKSESIENKFFDTYLQNTTLTAEVYRINSDFNQIILTTSRGPLIASDGYWEWTFHLTDEKLFGLGNLIIDHSEDNSTITKVIYKNRDNHSTMPVFLAYRNGTFHGVTVKHDGPLEISVLSSNLVVLRTVIGHWIELEVVVGPTPQDIHRQMYMDKGAPPAWILEPQICRSGSSKNITDFLESFQPNTNFRTECIHENLVMYLMHIPDGLTVVEEAIEKVTNESMKFVMAIPPQILYDSASATDAEASGILYRNSTGGIFKGRYLSSAVTYPDFTNENINDYMNNWKKVVLGNITSDGIVLVKNWPLNDEEQQIDPNEFPYLPTELKEALSYTLPWDSSGDNSKTLHITRHNSYGEDQLQVFTKTFPNNFIMSTSTTFGHSEPTTIENLDISWSNLKSSLINVLFQSVIGNHLVAVPVCGSTKNFNTEIQELACIRWYLVASTMPLLRVASEEPYRYPEMLHSEYATATVQKALEKRNQLLGYYYGFLYRGEPLVRPMWYNFYHDKNTLSLDEQYMIGDKLIVAHPFTSGSSKLKLYLPPAVGVWFEFWGGLAYDSAKENGWIQFNVVPTDWITFVAQGSIIPLKDNKNDPPVLGLTIALGCNSTACEASGTLLEDDTELHFETVDETLTISNITESIQYNLGIINLYKKDTTNQFPKMYNCKTYSIPDNQNNGVIEILLSEKCKII